MNAKSVSDFALAASADIVGGVSQDTLNRFAAKHYQLYPDIYKGSGESDPIDLKWQYQITKPITVALAESSRETDLLKRKILADPFLRTDKGLFRVNVAAPVVTVSIPDTTIHFTDVAGHDLATVTVNGSITASILVNATPPGTYTLQVTKVDLHITTRELRAAAGPTGCDLNKLIEHILDALLAAQLQRFIESLPLPQPHFVLDGILVQLTDVSVVDKTLLLALSARSASMEQLKTSTSTLHGETFERAVFGKALNKVISQPDHGKIQATMDLSGNRRELPGSKNMFGALDRDTLPPGDMFLAFANTVFQLLANKYLNIQVDKEHDSGGYAYYEYRYGYKVSNPRTAIISSGVQIKVDLLGYAEGSAGLKGCSSWIKVSISATATAKPDAEIDAQLLSKNNGKELWLHPFDFPFAIIVDVHIEPDVGPLDFILDLVASALLSLFSGVILPLMSLGLEVKLVTLPAQVPGTPVPAAPTIQSLGNWGGMLYVGFAIGF